MLIASLTAHEASHAWAALRGGDATAYALGQVSLDPRPHIRREPMGMVFVPLLFFFTSGWMIGWASTPYDPRWAYRHPRRAGWMALAGPAANLALAVASGLGIRLGLATGHFEVPTWVRFDHVTAAVGGPASEVFALVLSIAFTLNLLLAVFNLIPLPPLDGSGAVALLLGDAAARRFQEWMRQPALSLLGILAAWWLIGPVFGPIHRLALSLLYPGVQYG